MTSTRYGVRTPPPRSAPVGGGRSRGGGVPLWRHIDWVLVGAVALVTSFGALMVYSVTRGPVPPYDTSFVKRVIMFMVIGAVLMAATAMVDYRRLRDYWPFIYGGSVLLLLLVLIPGIGSRCALPLSVVHRYHHVCCSAPRPSDCRCTRAMVCRSVGPWCA